jgi:hypothetical protein
MNHDLRKLQALAKPVSTPDSALRAEIEFFGSQLGLRLPPSYLEFIEQYGFSGYWQQFWYVLDPRTDGGWTSPADDLSGRNILSAHRVIRASWPDDVPYPIFPEAGGLLPWAATDNGGRFFWLTEGPSESWTTIYAPDRSGGFTEIEMDVPAIVWGLISGEFRLFAQEFGEDYEYGEEPIVSYE